MSEEVEKHVCERYEIMKKLGRGAYGIVWKAQDKKSGKIVALKKVFEAFQNSIDAQRTYREAMYLQELNGHDNIVRLLSIIRAYNNKDLYLIFEYMETDLHLVIRAKILEDIHKIFITYQMLKALKYIHSAEIIHRDLKPSNLLIDSNCNIKIADFGLARSVAATDTGQNPTVSDYVATRWYRAPEILLGSKKYSKAVDVWSAGCILGELIIGKTLFAGKSTPNQIELIISLLGRPSERDVVSLNSALAWDVLNTINAKKRKSMTQIFGHVGKEGLDLLRKMLCFNPRDRITIEEALEHPFFRKFHCKEDEIVCSKVIKLPIDDNTKLSLKVYREAIYRDITCKIKRAKIQKGDAEALNLPKLKESNMSASNKDVSNGNKNFHSKDSSEKQSTNHTNPRRNSKSKTTAPPPSSNLKLRQQRHKARQPGKNSSSINSSQKRLKTQGNGVQRHVRRKSSTIADNEVGKGAKYTRYSSSKYLGKNISPKAESGHKKKNKLSGSLKKYNSNTHLKPWQVTVSPKQKLGSSHLMKSKSSLKHPFFRSKHSWAGPSKQHSLNEKSLKKMTKGLVSTNKSPTFVHKKSSSYFKPDIMQGRATSGSKLARAGLFKKRSTVNYFYKSKVKNKSYLVGSNSKNGISASSFLKRGQPVPMGPLDIQSDLLSPAGAYFLLQSLQVQIQPPSNCLKLNNSVTPLILKPNLFLQLSCKIRKLPKISETAPVLKSELAAFQTDSQRPMRKFRLIDKKGEGAFSEVLLAQSLKTGNYVAIKCMKSHFESIEQVNNFVEIQALRKLSPHPHIIRLLEALYDEPTGRLALVFELMDMNLYEAIKGRKSYLPESKVKNWIYQLIVAIEHMHMKGIFHRDIKPENILLRDDKIKLADFGSCRGIHTKLPYTEYISTRWYRAPECLLTDGYYCSSMDMWGVGCVFFEMLSLYPLFPGEENELNQIHKIFGVLGTPPKALLEKWKSQASHINFDFPQSTKDKKKKMESILTHVSGECADLIEKMLIYDPEKRITATEARNHAYFKELREDQVKRYRHLNSMRERDRENSVSQFSANNERDSSVGSNSYPRNGPNVNYIKININGNNQSHNSSMNFNINLKPKPSKPNKKNVQMERTANHRNTQMSDDSEGDLPPLRTKKDYKKSYKYAKKRKFGVKDHSTGTIGGLSKPPIAKMVHKHLSKMNEHKKHYISPYSQKAIKNFNNQPIFLVNNQSIIPQTANKSTNGPYKIRQGSRKRQDDFFVQIKKFKISQKYQQFILSKEDILQSYSSLERQ